jgi:hypothetical protein
MAGWDFLTNYARVLLCIAHDPGVRLRDIAARTGVAERRMARRGAWHGCQVIPDLAVVLGPVDLTRHCAASRFHG